MLKGRGFRDRYMEATLASTLVFSRAISRVISRGIRLTNGTVVNSLHVISFCNVLRTSRRMAINALNSRVGIRISARAPPTTLQ
jgi:hypothetical protein